MDANRIIEEIEAMDNAERIRTLEELFHKYFDNRPPQETITKEKIDAAWGKEDE